MRLEFGPGILVYFPVIRVRHSERNKTVCKKKTIHNGEAAVDRVTGLYVYKGRRRLRSNYRPLERLLTLQSIFITLKTWQLRCMSYRFVRWSRMAEEMTKAELGSSSSTTKSRSLWPSLFRWIPTSTDHIIDAEKRLLSLVNFDFYYLSIACFSSVVMGVWMNFRTPMFKNSKDDSPTLVMVHGYGASQGFFFRNFDALARRFSWGGSSRPDFTCKSTKRLKLGSLIPLRSGVKPKTFSNFILLGHSVGGYVAAKYALKHPEHIQHLILVGPAGFSLESDGKSEWLTRFRATWKGAVLNHLWESNFTPQKLVRSNHSDGFRNLMSLPIKYFPQDFSLFVGIGKIIRCIAVSVIDSDGLDAYWFPYLRLERVEIISDLSKELEYLMLVERGIGPWGPDLVRKYTSARFSSYSTGDLLTEEESKLLTDYVYHTVAAKASGELCLKYIFSFGAFARLPLLHSASEWKVPTTFIYGFEDWMNYQGAQEARKQMKAGHFVFIDNPSGFHSAVLYACRRFLLPDPDSQSLPEGLTSA
ncbi:1-acylglycerol-3-phosphate O-acyltransferase [Vitis vinifera]|uniref:1-acylglycerol-3-phosphate O-acyltransferase n=1 Tax=Vitis vinifera TaxID=29760 RepID=A0A438K183_VITVI|nr:1-acylglycerol-3-phosphate O-acyltransferase [Vitis vinifera]